MPEIKVDCLLLCAGKSARMKPDHKLLMILDDMTVLKKTAQEIQHANFNKVIAITGFQKESVAAELKKFSFQEVFNEHFESGLHSSIRAGVLQLSSEADFFAVCLADQPALSTADYNFLIERVQIQGKNKKIFFPIYAGKRGNPVVISKSLIPDILEHADDDRGCFYLLDKYPNDLHAIEMNNESSLMDIDTPELFSQMKLHLKKMRV